MARKSLASLIAKLSELMTASAWRIKEESTLAETVVVIVGTGGREGRVFVEWGQSNPAAVYGVLENAMEQLESQLAGEPVEEEGDE